ncbi:MAG: hypothetical protein J7639_25525 [Paenibacillaceae bacterium]|nr:hypothetical protein [Paenibacillaceae bacterium]
MKTRILFQWLAWLFVAGLAVQVFLAGLALFWNPAQWASHIGFSRVLIVFPVLLIVFAFVARLPVSMRLRSVSLLGMIVMLAVSANLPSTVGYLSALHPVIAVLLFLETVSIARKSGSHLKEAQPMA